MTPEEFSRLQGAGYNRIPLSQEVIADLDTPLSTYMKLAAAPYSYLFESVQGGEKWGRYSFIGLACRTVVRIHEQQITVSFDEQVMETLESQNPLSWVESFLARYKAPEIPGLPRFTGGLVGYFGYDTVRYIEPRLGPCAAPDALGVPDIMLMVSDEILAFDNLLGRVSIIVHANPETPDAYARAQDRVNGLAARLASATIPQHGSRQTEENQRINEADFVSEYPHADYKAGVGRCKQYIVDGDAMQIVLSQRMSAPYGGPPLDVYRALRGLNPSPYMFFLDLGDFHVIGSSPEILTRVEEGEITLRPIAGTRPRGADPTADKALEAELLADPKELAEHLMLVDLGRNDVGRVAETGSVKVTEQMGIERYSHVMHIVSNVVGTLRNDLTPLAALAATFPAGTLSGAPKVRAMEILDELEPVKRGVYSGAVGYIGWDGTMDTAIAIRTGVLKNKRLYVHAGAGIVADSDPEAEWQETLSKCRAVFRAAELASRNLHLDNES